MPVKFGNAGLLDFLVQAANRVEVLHRPSAQRVKKEVIAITGVDLDQLEPAPTLSEQPMTPADGQPPWQINIEQLTVTNLVLCAVPEDIPQSLLSQLNRV